MPSNASAPVSTTTANDTLALAASSSSVSYICVQNTGANAGLVAFECNAAGGLDYHYIPAQGSFTFDLKHRGFRASPNVYIKRIGAADMANVYVSTF